MSQDAKANTLLIGSPDATVAEAPNPSVPPLLAASRQDALLRQFVEEYEPVGPTESAIVRDLARQAAAMDLWGAAAGAAERQAARGLPALASHVWGDSEELDDALLAGAASAEVTDRCERHGFGHSRGFYRALHVLAELQGKRKKRESACGAAPPPPFADESACERYLEDRLCAGNAHCRRCGAGEGYYLAARRVWECSRCKSQTGLRSGTVMARSALPLWAWFEAIRWILWRPAIGATELANRIGVRRLSTVRMMARKIRRAMAAENGSELLAGLDVHYARRKT